MWKCISPFCVEKSVETNNTNSDNNEKTTVSAL